MVSRMRRAIPRVLVVVAILLAGGLPLASLPAGAWGNGSPTSPEFPNFGIHDIACDIALRTASLTNEDLLTWLNDWYERNATDGGYSFDPASTRPTKTDNVNAYTDDPDTHWKDWENHTLYLHPRSGWDPPEGDAASRVSQLYNMTRDHLYGWLMNGSVRYDADQHRAAYYGGLMAHYVMDVTQFGHTDWTRLDHSHPMDDPENATYHSYYEARSWSDRALRTVHVDLMMRQLPELKRVSDPAKVVRDLATFVNGRHGPDVQFLDVDMDTVVLGSTYVKMLEMFVTDYDARNSHNGARGYSQDLWNLTLENLFAGMDNLTCLWTSAFLDARDMFRADAADVVMEQILLEPATGAYEGLTVNVTATVRNAGATDTGDFNVAFLVDNESASEARLQLDAGQTMAVDFVWTAVAGVHEIRVIADIYQQVPEGNETNNVGWKMYAVQEAHHGSVLEAETTTLTLLQDSSGRFNLTLTNTGNKPDTYRVYLDTYPGTIDFSMTLNLDERVHLDPGAGVLFHIDVTTSLDNPVGPRYLRVVAEGTNSSSELTLAVIIEERDVAPHIEVEYGFYGNVSVPMAFDASGTWDRNGDPVTFAWFLDSSEIGSGPELEWTFDQEGVYVLQLVASDGRNNSTETLEVSIQDALVPEQVITKLRVDIDAVEVEWAPWNSSKYFSETRFYMGTSPDSRDLVEPANLVQTITLPYVNSTVLLAPDALWGEEYFVVGVTESIYGMLVLSNVVHVESQVLYDCSFGCPPPPIELDWISQVAHYDDNIPVAWRTWTPIGRGGYYEVVLRPWSTDLEDTALRIDNLTHAYHVFEDLPMGLSGTVEVRYTSPGGEHSVGYATMVGTLPNELPTVELAPLIETSTERRTFVYVRVEDPDGNFSRVTVDWGDGSEGETMDSARGLLELVHTYGEEGTYILRVEAVDLDGGAVNATATVVVTDDGGEGPGGGWDPVIAIALIIFVALLGVIAGHLSGYYRIGREQEGRERVEEQEAEPEPEPEPTAEEIIEELEEDLGEGGEDEDYFDHEPSVSELEEMIPRDSE